MINFVLTINITTVYRFRRAFRHQNNTRGPTALFKRIPLPRTHAPSSTRRNPRFRQKHSTNIEQLHIPNNPHLNTTFLLQFQTEIVRKFSIHIPERTGYGKWGHSFRIPHLQQQLLMREQNVGSFIYIYFFISGIILRLSQCHSLHIHTYINLLINC